jgi:hypothetical protein
VVALAVIVIKARRMMRETDQQILAAVAVAVELQPLVPEH